MFFAIYACFPFTYSHVFHDNLRHVLVETESRFFAYAVNIASMILLTARFLCVIYTEICINVTAALFLQNWSPRTLDNTAHESNRYLKVAHGGIKIKRTLRCSSLRLTLKRSSTAKFSSPISLTSFLASSLWVRQIEWDKILLWTCVYAVLALLQSPHSPEHKCFYQSPQTKFVNMTSNRRAKVYILWFFFHFVVIRVFPVTFFMILPDKNITQCSLINAVYFTLVGFYRWSEMMCMTMLLLLMTLLLVGRFRKHNAMPNCDLTCLGMAWVQLLVKREIAAPWCSQRKKLFFDIPSTTLLRARNTTFSLACEQALLFPSLAPSLPNREPASRLLCLQYLLRQHLRLSLPRSMMTYHVAIWCHIVFSKSAYYHHHCHDSNYDDDPTNAP